LSAIKEAYEDIQRWRADSRINNAPISIVNDIHSDSPPNNIKCAEIRVGDVVRVEEGQVFPADIIPLSSSDPDGRVYVETSDLDGEINLKIFRAVAFVILEKIVENGCKRDTP